MVPLVGYSIESIAALKAITAANRSDGYCRILRGERNSWYMFVAASTAIADGLNILMPNDNPVTGRWHRNSSASAISGTTVCDANDGQCAIGGKAIKFYAPFSGEVVITPSFDIAIGVTLENNFLNNTAASDKTIEVHRWSQEPNFTQTGRTFVANLPRAGGRVKVTLDSTYRWLSVSAYNDAVTSHDTVCVTFENNLITLIDFS